MARAVMLGFVFVLLFSGCDALKSLYGEIYGEDDSSDSGGDGGGGFGGGSRDSGGNRSDGGGGDGGGNRNVSVSFDGIMVDGNGTTTLVSLVFDRDIDGLLDRDVRVDGGDTGATGGALVRTGQGTYALAISGVWTSGEIVVTVGKSGYIVSPATRTAQVNFDPGATPVTFGGLMANGEAGSVTTTAFTLTFSPGISLVPGDIKLTAGSTGAVMGALTGSGQTYTLVVSGVTAGGEVGVTVVKDGWTISPALTTVGVHHQTIPLAAGGFITYEPVGDNPLWEIHTFTYNNGVPEELVFINSAPSELVTAEVLVIGGGGGGGGSIGEWNTSSGGGAGRFVYHPAFKVGAAENWDNPGTLSVTVGGGGIGGTQGGGQGGNGGVSEIVRYTGYKISAPGGGGGAGNNGVASGGNNGGSGGGSHGSFGGSPTKAVPGTFPVEDGVEDYGTGGGQFTGGGAGGIGKGRESEISGESKWYAAGGYGSGTGANGFQNAASNTGNGGYGGVGTHAGGNGGSGIVVVRFERPN
jgi:hypothetical protein